MNVGELKKMLETVDPEVPVKIQLYGDQGTDNDEGEAKFIHLFDGSGERVVIG